MSSSIIKKIILSSMAAGALFVADYASADQLVILHTNDIHSQIDPNDKDMGGVVRRKVLIDSVRAVQPNVLLVDAGDAVQGTLFFNLFKGEVEHKVLEMLGYDMAIVGNHDFDNGVDELAANIANDTNVKWLTTNYDVSQSALNGLFSPYNVVEYGGKKIAFIGINLQPKGMIAEGNYDGVEYIDAFKAANSTAWHMKHNEGVDMVVAITHIGYDGEPAPRDVSLAAASEDIDIIIGGHSHTRLEDGKDFTRVPNMKGEDVLVVQTGSRGVELGEITIDLDSMTAQSRLIPVDSRLDSRPVDENLVAMIQPYRYSIDSIMGIKIAKSKVELDKDRLLNLFADLVLERGEQLAGNVDLSIINKGGIRHTLPKGDITVGMIMTTVPFNNKVTVIDIKGSDLLDALNVMAHRGGDGIGGNISVEMTGENPHVESVIINGAQIEPDRTYRVSTIDYLADGGDYMEPLTKGAVVAKSDNVMYDDAIALLKGNKKINPSSTVRMK